MKNLKKVLALVTVVAMLLACVPAVLASSYSDVSDSASYAEAVEMLSKLGIFTGYEDGTFQPDKSITRAEAAAVITRFLNQEGTAKAMAGSTIFTDMGGAEWATGYVNFGVQKGYINGMGDGTFHPSDAVTYEQIVKMIVAALGYEIKAQDQGGYPSGYLAVASQLEITKGTSGSNGAASRGTVAKLLYQALDAKKMVVISYKSNGEKEYGDGKTPLEEDHQVDKYEAVIVGSFLIDMKNADDDKTVTFDLNDKDAKVNDDKPGDAKPTVMVGDTDAASFVGQRVTAYVQEDDNTGDPTIIAIAAKGTKNSVLTVPAANMESIDDETASYWKDRDSERKANVIDLNDPTVIINNEKSSIAKIELDEITGVVTFISNDGNTNNGYEFVIVAAYDNEFVIDEIDAENFIVEAIAKSTSGLTQYEMDPEDEDTMYTIIKDGEVASFEDLEEGDTVSVIGENTKNVVFYVSTAKAEGAVTRISSGTDPKYTIDGSQYKAKANLPSGEIKVADEGTFYINVDGIIIYADANSDAEGNYGYFVASDTKTSFGKTAWTIEFVDENGNDVTAKLATRVKVGVGVVAKESKKSEEFTDETFPLKEEKEVPVLDKNGKQKFTDKNNNGQYDEEIDELLFETVYVDVPQLIKYDTNASGDITKIIIAKDQKTEKQFSYAGGYEEDETTYTAKTNRAGKFEFDDDTVVFNVKDDVNDADDVSVSTIKALFQDGEYAPAFDAFDQDTDSKVVGAIVAYGAAGNVDESSNVVIVTSVSNTKFGDENGYVIEGLQGGKAVSFNVCPDKEELDGESDDPANIGKGDVIMVAEGVDYVTNIDLKVKVDSDPKHKELVSAPYDSDFYHVAKSREARDTLDFVDSRTNNDLTLVNYTYDSKTDEFNVAGARFTLVGFTGANVVVKASSVGAINTAKYNYAVYVRYYDDDCMDVVIFELSEKDR